MGKTLDEFEHDNRAAREYHQDQARAHGLAHIINTGAQLAVSMEQDFRNMLHPYRGRTYSEILMAVDMLIASVSVPADISVETHQQYSLWAYQYAKGANKS